VFVQYTGPKNEWFELEIPTDQVAPLLTRLQQIRDDLQDELSIVRCQTEYVMANAPMLGDPGDGELRVSGVHKSCGGAF
jgi:hypothetical protein